MTIQTSGARMRTRVSDLVKSNWADVLETEDGLRWFEVRFSKPPILSTIAQDKVDVDLGDVVRLVCLVIEMKLSTP